MLRISNVAKQRKTLGLNLPDSDVEAVSIRNKKDPERKRWNSVGKRLESSLLLDESDRDGCVACRALCGDRIWT
jgi:hypothetical protein